MRKVTAIIAHDRFYRHIKFHATVQRGNGAKGLVSDFQVLCYFFLLLFASGLNCRQSSTQ